MAKRRRRRASTSKAAIRRRYGAATKYQAVGIYKRSKGRRPRALRKYYGGRIATNLTQVARRERTIGRGAKTLKFQHVSRMLTLQAAQLSKTAGVLRKLKR